MLLHNDIQAFLLYYSHTVQVTLVNDSRINGAFDEYNETNSWIKVDGEFIGIEEIKDIEYLGKVTDFHTIKNQVGIIDDSIEFGLSNLVNQDDIDTILFQEFDCDVACHLIEIAGKLSAVDVRVLRKSHVLNFGILQKTDCLYYCDDGECIHGFLNVLDESTIIMNGHEIGIEHIKNITPTPQIGDNVTLMLVNGEYHSGIVNAIYSDQLELLEDTTIQL